MSDFNVKVDLLDQELEKRLTPFGLIRYAENYYQGFVDLYDKYPDDVEMYEVKYFLLFHSIELALKAYLRKKGKTRKQLLDYGHNLEKIIKEIHMYNLLIDIDFIVRIVMGNRYYNTKQFEYPQTGVKSFPPLNEMKEHTLSLIKEVRKRVQYMPIKKVQG